MVAAAFPLAKLAYLAVRQISKPIAQGIQTRAKASPFFRTYICMPPAQFYHWADVKIKMWMLNLGQPVKVAKLNEEQAIEQGAQILGEMIIFSIAALCLIADYIRSSRKEQAREAAHEARLFAMENSIVDLGMAIEKQDAQIRELTRVCVALKPKNVKVPEYKPLAPIRLDFRREMESVGVQVDPPSDARPKPTTAPLPAPSSSSTVVDVDKKRPSS
ncbi:putative OPA3-like protein CG13603 [Paramacrobiotus metropolitanus]|uniref:putative OPA3-like protein CG13603 n=1 Tax=Paramacrobiotus metropolitanus TaxID=2943436 RepID=UPI002445D1D5|nr:putative OPA3-like protein CG13603 [Paramacrobiotus metropolitanus]